MQWPRRDKVEVYARAIQGLLALEPNPNRQSKYLDFVDIYTALDDNERRLYRERYPQEEKTMATLCWMKGCARAFNKECNKGSSKASSAV